MRTIIAQRDPTAIDGAVNWMDSADGVMIICLVPEDMSDEEIQEELDGMFQTDDQMSEGGVVRTSAIIGFSETRVAGG